LLGIYIPNEHGFDVFAVNGCINLGAGPESGQ